ncbi:MAG: prepilin-type N-terminal cleavage/methylation domain-containing protein [Candidatus Omnitrophica bacterium]|nr:prepilin-type N-terminal cleavage/methylation domain-containing protein [Candidatus Omnitrophota bacterium]
MRVTNPEKSGFIKAFTLLEIMIVVVIIGILATLGVNYRPIVESALNREAVVNLKLIAAGERVYRLERGEYYGSTQTSFLNTNLRLYLPMGPNVKWSYAVEITGPGAAFTAKATRVNAGADGRVWELTSANVDNGEEPSCTGGNFCG